MTPLALRVAAVLGLVAAGSTWVSAVRSTPGQAAPDDLPDGPGRRILQVSCTTCHDLDEVTKFKGYYTRAQWRDVVQTMVDYGAKLQPGEADVLADYLNEHLGKR